MEGGGKKKESERKGYPQVIVKKELKWQGLYTYPEP